MRVKIIFLLMLELPFFPGSSALGIISGLFSSESLLIIKSLLSFFSICSLMSPRPVLLLSNFNFHLFSTYLVYSHCKILRIVFQVGPRNLISILLYIYLPQISSVYLTVIVLLLPTLHAKMS